jgi:hypothetical protein
VQILKMVNFPLGPAVTTGAYLWRFATQVWDDHLTAPCPLCGERFAVTGARLGQGMTCPRCAGRVKLNPFVCDPREGDDEHEA